MNAAPKFEMRMGFPPVYDRAAAKWPTIKGRPIIFAYAPYIYCTNRAKCGPEKVAHEAIHLARQTQNGMTPEAWWDRYLTDDDFRRQEEVLAHVAEYLFLCEKESGRGARRRNLVIIAGNLASPIYGRLFSIEEAKSLLKSCAEEAGKRADEV